MSVLFENSEINGMMLKNRFVRSATWEGMAGEDGACTRKITNVMTDLAEGQVGLIISSHAYVRRDGQAGPFQLGIYQDEFIDAYREMTTAVHERDSKIVLQITHAGAFASAKLIGEPPLAFSNVEDFTNSPRRIMEQDDLDKLGGRFCPRGAACQGSRIRWRSNPRGSRISLEPISFPCLEQTS